MTSPATITVNVRHRLGLPAKLMIHLAFLLGWMGVDLPTKYVIRAVNRWWYVSVDRGPWYRLSPEVPEDLVP